MNREILVCCGTGCLANGAQAVVDAFSAAISGDGSISVKPAVKKTGCNGFCENGPIVTIYPDNITYYKVRPADVSEIIKSLDRDDSGNAVCSREENPFYAAQYKLRCAIRGALIPLPSKTIWIAAATKGLRPRSPCPRRKSSNRLKPAACAEEAAPVFLQGVNGVPAARYRAT